MQKTLKGNSISRGSNTFLNIIFMLYAAICILPILVVISVSLSDEKTVVLNGYSFLPQKFTLYAYKFIFQDGSQLITSYIVTVSVTVIGAILSLLVVAMFAYPLSRPDLKYKNAFTFYIFFTMLFSGGLVPWYIVCTKILHLQNTYAALVLPLLFNSWYVIILRTFFKETVPDSIIESAKIDGAGELRIFFQIVSPLSKAGYATVLLFATLGYWNDFFNCMMLTSEAKFRTLQYFIYKILTEVSAIQQMAQKMGTVSHDVTKSLPQETTRFAMCLVALGPILFVYPFFQKYFINGLTIGAVKG